MNRKIIGSSPWPVVRCAVSTMAEGSRRLLAAIVMGLCPAGPAIAGTIDPGAPDIEGRWVAEGGNLTLDLSRCKAGWCGVEVTGASCGRTALRLTAADPERRPDKIVQYLGQFERTAETQPYVVQASIVQNTPAVKLKLVGHSGDRFEMWRRTFPLSMLLARSGEAQCRPDSKVS